MGCFHAYVVLERVALPQESPHLGAERLVCYSLFAIANCIIFIARYLLFNIVLI